MKKKYLLRLLTLAIYFLPFSFFYSGCEGVAFNKADALALEITRNNKVKPIDSFAFISDTTKAKSDTISNNKAIEIIDTTSLSYKANKIAQEIVERALLPTNNSISAIGITQIFANTFGRICIILSIILSVVLLISERFFRQKIKLIQNLFLINLLCVIAFIIDGIIYKVELKFGVWCLLFFLIVQLYLETKRVNIKT
jgi:hypothetical protein